MGNISKVTFCRNIASVTLRNVPSESQIIGEILSAIAENGVNVDMISQTAPLGQTVDIAFSISMDSVGVLMPVVNGLKTKYTELNLEFSVGMTKFNFYDSDMVDTPGVAAQVFSMLSSIPVTMITTSTVDISILVPAHEEDLALELCRKTYGVEPEELPFI